MVNDLGNTDDLELMPLGSSYTVAISASCGSNASS